ncbi:MAG: alpha/beta hydrolase [Rubrobacteraceae bacterium]
MDLTQRMDPELVAAYREVPPKGFVDWEDLPETRVFFEQMTADIPDSENVTKEDRTVPGPEGAPEVPVRVYRPVESSGILPGVLWIHGGGYIVGSVDQEDLVSQNVTEAVECVVVSVDYRLAPEHPFPAPLEDCYAALKWMASNAGDLGVDPARIAITGPSAGGGLTAGLALLVRDRGEVAVAFQAPIYAMIDDRNETPSAHANGTSRIWSRQDNENGWNAYLGNGAGKAGVSPYAAAARATDLSGLPPAYLAVGTLDIFLDENVGYARRLIEAGVPTELHVYPGLIHGSDTFLPGAASSQRLIADRNAALKRALHPQSVAIPG